MKKHRTRAGSSGELHDLGLAAAARAIRNGEVSSETYVGQLLERARQHAALNAFITIDEPSVLEAARQADRSLRARGSAPLLGVPLAIKDSYLTKGLTTTFGTSVLTDFKPARDAVAVAQLKDAGAIVFGKNNLVEMSVRADRAQRTSWPGKEPVQQGPPHRWLLQRRGRVGGRSHRSCGARRRHHRIQSVFPPRCVVWRYTSLRRAAGLALVWRRYPTPSTQPVSSLAALKIAISWTPYSPRALSTVPTMRPT